MPYIKKKEPDFVEVKRLVIGYGLNAPKLAMVLDKSVPTARKKLDKPELFTLGDIKNIVTRGHIPIEEIREAIKK